ncbi:hypothetical protein NLX67_14315 [Domibacillus sp. A3M-37]|uniref:hypothetical protein n=1 Tax=Domibacillus sp. A3M-37 TaxID=2962037 RepID=UPI0020B65D2E|nr:hypothetical protein [Domibacillus sp. A3M-37]MCP3763552.1 hypothetical protein [Domibacillus sp. A3M-37]
MWQYIAAKRSSLSKKSGLFIVPIFRKTAWKTERKESRNACWALRRPMMSFSLTKQEASFLVFVRRKTSLVFFILKRKVFVWIMKFSLAGKYINKLLDGENQCFLP